MRTVDGTIIEKHRFPSPCSQIDLYVVTYISQGLKVKGYLAEPKGEGLFPGLLYLRGGIKNVGMTRISRVIQFASEGFVVMAPFYRGNRGGEGTEDFAGEDRYDAVHACHLLQHHPRVDKQSNHVYGFSRGGLMALWTAILVRELSSVVVWGGVSDLVLTYEERVDLRKMMKRVIGGTPEKEKAGYVARTPLDSVDRIHAPILIVHGKQDEHVSVEHAKLLEAALKKADKPFEMWLFDEYTHHFPPIIQRKVTRKITEWMKSWS